MNEAATKVVGIFGDDPLTSRILGLLLEGAGYEARALNGTAVLERPVASLAGVDLVLCMPLPGDERKDALHSAMKANPQTAAIPVLNLSTGLGSRPDEREESVLPWPWSTDALVRAIERVLRASGDGGLPP